MTVEKPATTMDVDKFRLPIRRCAACGSWMGIAAVRHHECHRDDPIIDAILSEYSRLLEQSDV